MALEPRNRPPRNGSGRWLKTLESAERDAEACRMKARGHTYQQIADALGYGDKCHAHRAVQRALATAPRESAMELREIQRAQLDELTIRALEVLERIHFVVSASGRVATGDDGKPIVDDAPVLAAIDRLLKIMDRRARLEGLDAPAKTEVITLDSLDAQIAALTAELARGADAAEDAVAAGAEG